MGRLSLLHPQLMKSMADQMSRKAKISWDLRPVFIQMETMKCVWLLLVISPLIQTSFSWAMPHFPADFASILEEDRREMLKIIPNVLFEHVFDYSPTWKSDGKWKVCFRIITNQYNFLQCCFAIACTTTKNWQSGIDLYARKSYSNPRSNPSTSYPKNRHTQILWTVTERQLW